MADTTNLYVTNYLNSGDGQGMESIKRILKYVERLRDAYADRPVEQASWAHVADELQAVIASTPAQEPIRLPEQEPQKEVETQKGVEVQEAERDPFVEIQRGLPDTFVKSRLEKIIGYPLVWKRLSDEVRWQLLDIADRTDLSVTRLASILKAKKSALYSWIHQQKNNNKTLVNWRRSGGSVPTLKSCGNGQLPLPTKQDSTET